MSKGTVNRVIILGRLGADPDIRHTTSGTSVATVNLATTESYKEGDEWKDRTEWHRVVAFGKTAEFIGQYCTKGKLLYVEGSLRTRQWEDKEGAKKYTTEIMVKEAQLVSGGNSGDSGGNKSSSSGKPSGGSKSGGSKQKPSGGFDESELSGGPDLDDIPF